MLIAIKEKLQEGKSRVLLGITNTDFWRDMTDNESVEQENLPATFNTNGQLIAFIKMDRASDILMFDDEFLNKEITNKNIVKEIVPYIKQRFKNCNYKLNKECWDNILTVCDNEHIYSLSPDFIFAESDFDTVHGNHYYCNFLKQVLDNTIGEPAEERIVKAFKFCCKQTRDNCFPIVIFDTSTKQRKVVYKGDE